VAATWPKPLPTGSKPRQTSRGRSGYRSADAETRSYPRSMASWRDSASGQAQADLDALLSAVLPFAERTLSKYGEMFPFGAAVSSQGQLEMLAGDSGSGGKPASEAVLQALYDGSRASCDTRRAFAFVADVRADGADAVRVELEHQEGAAIVVLVPYCRGRLTKKITFGQMSGGMGRPNIWTAG
jgi:hypothetical protein